MKKLHDFMGITVFAYAISYMVLILLYCCPRILAEYSSYNVSRLAENFEFPLEIFSWGFLAICSGYSGIDRKMLHDKSLLPNKTEVKDTGKLVLVIFLLIIILLESVLLNLFLSHDCTVYTEIGKQVFKGIKLPLEGIATALVSTLTIYVTATPFVKGSSHKKEGNGNEENNSVVSNDSDEHNSVC